MRRMKSPVSLGSLLLSLALVVTGVLPVAVVGAPSSRASAQSATGATILVIAGAVEVAVGPDGAFALAQDGQAVNAGDRVRTGVSGVALLTFFDGSESQLGPESEVVLERAQSSSAGPGISLAQAAGTTVNRVRQQGNSGGFQTNTPSSVALVRGTTYVVTVKQVVPLSAAPTPPPGALAPAAEQRAATLSVTYPRMVAGSVYELLSEVAYSDGETYWQARTWMDPSTGESWETFEAISTASEFVGEGLYVDGGSLWRVRSFVDPATGFTWETFEDLGPVTGQQTAASVRAARGAQPAGELITVVSLLRDPDGATGQVSLRGGNQLSVDLRTAGDVGVGTPRTTARGLLKTEALNTYQNAALNLRDGAAALLITQRSNDLADEVGQVILSGANATGDQQLVLNTVVTASPTVVPLATTVPVATVVPAPTAAATAVPVPGSDGPAAAPAPPADTSGPAVSTLSANPTALSSGSVTINGTASDSGLGDHHVATAEFFINSIGTSGSGTPLSATDGGYDTVTESVTGSISPSALGLTDGTHTVYVHAQDGVGNWGRFSAVSFVWDTTPPVVSSITRAGSDPTNATSVSWIVSFNESVTGVDTGDFTLIAGTGVTATLSGLSGSGSSYVVTASPVSGNDTLGLKLVDNNSIVNAPGLPLGGAAAGDGDFVGQVYTIDQTAPAAPAITSMVTDTGISNTDKVTSDTTPTFSGTAEASSTVKVYKGATLLGSTTADGTGNWSFTPSSQSDGTHTVTATATDAAGNTSASSSTFSVVIDTVAPTVALTYSLNRPVKSGESLTITATFSEAPSGTPTIQISAPNATGPTAMTGSGTNWSYAHTVGTGDGTATVIIANGADVAGNANATATNNTFVVDNTDPFITSITRTSGSPTNSSVVSFIVTFSEQVNNVDTSDFAPVASVGITGASVTGVSPTSGPAQTYAVTVNTGTGDGTLGLALSSLAGVNDLAGNAAFTDPPVTPSTNESYTIQKSAPATPTGLALTSGTDSGVPGDSRTNNQMPAVSGTAGSGTTVKLYDSPTCSGAAIASGSNTAFSTGLTSTVVLAEGSHSITANATDSLNQTSPCSAPLGIVIDTTAPVLSTAAVGGSGGTVVLTYNETLNALSTPATSSFTVLVSGVARSVSSVSVSGLTVTLNLASPVTSGQTVTVSYTVPGSNQIQDSAGNNAGALSGQAVSNP